MPAAAFPLSAEKRAGLCRRRFVLDLIVMEGQVRTDIDTEDESFQGFMVSIAEKGGPKSPLTSSSRLHSFSMVISAVISQPSTPVSDTIKAFKEDTMKVVRIDEVAKETYLNPLFTGPEVAKQVLLPDSKENVVNVVHFGKGVRNKFHTHDCEQILIITAGRGVVATEKEEKIVTVGDIVLISAGEKHWHGSNGESDFSHIFVSKKGSKMTQLED